MEELSSDDGIRIREIKTWLKQGMTLEAVAKKLKNLGYNEYHVYFMLEKASGKKLVPKPPKIDVMKGVMQRAAITLVIAIVVIGGIIWWYLGV